MPTKCVTSARGVRHQQLLDGEAGQRAARHVHMVRALVEEAATLASLALFLGMIAIWAQVIATL